MAYHETRTYRAGFPITSRLFERFNFHAHWHFELELMLVTRGSIHMSVNSAYRLLHAGDIAVCACEDIHWYEGASPDSEVLIVVFHPDLLGEAVDLSLRPNAFVSFLDPQSIAALGISDAQMENMRECLRTIHREMESQERDYEMFVKAAVLQLMALLSRHASGAMASVGTDSTEPVDSSGMKLVRKALHYIEMNYAQDITLDQISEHLSISPFYFSRVFSHVTGLTFKNYLNTVKVEKAQNLIRTSSKPILDIAYDCGFNSIRTFNRVFLNIKGYTPTSLR